MSVSDILKKAQEIAQNKDANVQGVLAGTVQPTATGNTAQSIWQTAAVKAAERDAATRNATTTPASTAKVGANLAGSLAADGSGTGTNNSILGILSPKYTKLAASGKEEASAAASKEAAAKNALAVALPQMPLKMQSAMKQETEYDPVTGFDMPTQDAARVDARRLGAGTEYAVRTGLDAAASGISSTLDLLIGKNITLLGNLIGQDWSQNPISAINERLQAEKTANQQILSEQMQRAGVSKTGETVANLGTMVTAAVPQAVIALLSAGTSLAGQGTTAALQAASSVGMATAGTKLVELGRTMSTALTAMAKSPNYWTAFLQVAGNNYDDEKAKGASDFRAVAFAVVNGLLNAMVEVGGGGIQELPTQLKSGSSSAVMAWVESMFDEGKEEVVQGVIERLLQNVIVGENNALFSTTDANAVINPVTAAKEFGGGALVGGILGGGQSLIAGGGTNVPGGTVQNAETTRTAQTAQTQEQTAPVTQQSTQAAQVADNAVAAIDGGGAAQNTIAPNLTLQPQNTAQNESAEQPDTIDENSIKTGKGIISSLKIKYVPDLKAEARNWHTYIEVGDKFFSLDAEGQAEVLAHEVQHTLAQNLYNGDSTLFEAIMNNPAFGVRKEAPNGKIYWEGIFGDVGSNSVDETFTQALTVYDRNPAWMKENHPDAYEFIKSYKEANNPVQAPVIAQDATQAKPATYTENAAEPNTAQTAQEQSDVEAQRDAQAAAEAHEEIDSGALKKAEATVTEIVTKPVTNSKAQQIIDDPALSAAFERLSGETLTGTRSEQRSIIKDYAAALEAEREMAAARNSAKGAELPEGVGAAEKGFSTTPYTQWQEDTPDNGFHDMGEKARRNVGLPKVNPQGENTMKTAQTVMEAANTPDTRVAQIEQYMVDGKAAYVPVSNESLATKAENTIEYKGWQTALTDWTADVRRGKANAELVAVGAQLINSAGNSNASASEYLNLFADYANLLNATGKSLQAARILKTLTPEGKLYGIKRSVDSIKAEVRGAEDIEIPAELVKEYKEATTDEARDKVIDKITQSVADQIPSTVIDKWTALRYVNMLGNFKTQVRNVVGNVGMGLISKAKRTIEAALQQVFTPREQRTRAIGYSKGLLKAAWNDFLLVKNEALGEGKYHEGYNGTRFARAVNDQRAIFKNSGAWGTKTDSSAFAKAARQITDALWKVPEAYRVAANWAMEQGDIIFNRATYADTLAGYLRAKGYTAQQFNDGAIPESVLEAARSDAIRESQEATFRDTNAVSRFASRVLRGEDTPKTVKAVAEGIAPFRKTPANILVRAEEYSMLGAVNTAVKAIQKSSGNSEVSGVDVINSLSKTLTGTGLTFLGMALYNAGWLRGKDDDDNQEAFDLLRGKQDYSITLPTGENFTVDWLSPASMPVLMGATLAQATFESGLSISDVEEVLTSIADPMIEMSMLQGLNNALDNIKYSDNNLIQLVISSAVSYLSQGLTNTLLGQVERTFGENTRQSNYSVKDSALPSWLQYSIAKASAKTPGWDYNQVEYIDAWGRTQSTGALGERALSNFLSPSYISNDRSAEVDDELQRVYDALDGEENVFPTRVTMSDTIKGEALTEDTYKVYATTRGQTALKELGKLFKSSEYKSMSDAEKANAIQDVYSAANETAKQAAVESAGGMYFTDKDHEARYEEYKSAGLSPSRAYDLYKTLDGLTFPDGATNAEKQQTTVQTIYSGGYTEKQTAALVGLLYTNSAKTSLLSDLNVSDRLISLYLTSGNTDMINMTVPSTVSENSVSYELTDAEKATFRQLYTDYFNQRATYISTEQQLNKLRDEAWAEAKAAVIAARG